MRTVFCLCIFAWSVVIGQDINSMRNMPKYEDRYEYLEVEGILESKRLVRNYVDCLINAKPCTPEGKTLKRLLPEALRTKCVRCTEKQKRTAVRVIKKLKTEYPEEWKKLSSRWDPTGDFTRYFEEFLAKEEFNTITTGNEFSQPPSPPSPPRPPLSLTPSLSSTSSPPAVVVLNRFGDAEETPNAVMASRPKPGMVSGTMRPAMMPSTMRPQIKPIDWNDPTQAGWVAAAASEAIPTRVPAVASNNDFKAPFSTAITIIDQIGYKIIRTTELVTDILKNTVKAVVGI